MVTSSLYSLADVLAVAKIHPFYSDTQYPPDKDTIQAAREQGASALHEPHLTAQPFLRKKDLYATIDRLVSDTSPQNTYRHNVYTSITGGGSNSKPLFFATDALENRRHRAYFGQFLRSSGLIKPGDWVLTTHYGGDLYRSLDLTLEIMENAGASALAAGAGMPPAKAIQTLQDYHVNVLAGDGSQVVQMVHHISMLTPTERDKIKLDRIIYTSEPLTAAQKTHIHAVLGGVSICSILGSAEAGPYGVTSPDLVPTDLSTGNADFIIDTRMTLIEILPFSFTEGDDAPDPVAEGQAGILVQTSLTRLRNPLVRYLTGDVGSLLPLPDKAKSLIPEAQWRYMRVLRLQGRDRRFSFEWSGTFIDFEEMNCVMAETKLGILQWQVILDKMETSKASSLDVRLLCTHASDDAISRQAVVDRLRGFFYIDSANEHSFRITFVDALTGFELSQTGRKVVKFIDRFT
ncbi:hypothetical protein FZEAL_3939 [Fusarium zealandicum]|uniref:AMP-dependent synthetase/ligase domain-containing protein n=1 Tax=Fusarium zealandicum TaxID=1053134 RepID=A0A8H4UND1_9HYPO|nr:hypothetical protein FZEAL_3939 [Fusarium zealandicum]